MPEHDYKHGGRRMNASSVGVNMQLTSKCMLAGPAVVHMFGHALQNKPCLQIHPMLQHLDVKNIHTAVHPGLDAKAFVRSSVSWSAYNAKSTYTSAQVSSKVGGLKA